MIELLDADTSWMARLERAATARMRSWTLLGERCCGYGMDDDVGSGKMALDGGGGCHGDLLGALEGEVARHAEGDVGEVAGAGAAGAQAVDGEDAGDGDEVGDDVWCGPGEWAGVASVRAPMVRRARLPADVEDDRGDDERGNRVGELERGDVPVLSGVGWRRGR